MKRSLPSTGTSIEIDFYEDFLLDMDTIPATKKAKEEQEERQRTVSTIKERYKLVSCGDDKHRTTLLVALEEPVFIRNLERDLRDTGIEILAVDHKSYLGDSEELKKEDDEKAERIEKGTRKVYHNVLEKFAGFYSALAKDASNQKAKKIAERGYSRIKREMKKLNL
jgi:hypothetical protein